MQKFKRDGKVAVVISPGFGSGWSTSYPEYPDLLWDPTLVELLLTDSKKKEIVTYLRLRYPDVNLDYIDDLKVEWVPEGEQFYVHEYDGNEYIVDDSDENWHTA
jgi:hypothetical protein